MSIFPPIVRRHSSVGVLLIVMFIFGILEAVTRLHLIPRIILIPPDEMFVALGGIIFNGELWPNLVRTVWEVCISLGLAIAVGVPIGLCFWRIPYLEQIWEPYLVGMYAMPLILFYPFALVIFGLGSIPVIVIAASMGLVPVVLNGAAAFKQVPDIYFRVGRVFGCKGPARFFRITLPAATPLLFAGLKLSLIYSFIGVIVMEFMTGNIGLGFKVSYDYNAFKIPEMYAYVLAIIILATLIVSAFTFGEKRLRREAEH